MAIRLPGKRSTGNPRAPRTRLDSHVTACRHLRSVDSTMRQLIDRVGPCELVPRRGAFVILCNSIISQQLSLSAAATIFGRFARLYPHCRLSPAVVRDTPAESLRAVGLSNQKARYIQDLALGFLDGRIQPRMFSTQSNEEIIAALRRIKGIGRWTVEMFLIFSLNRLDVLPVDDLGIRQSVQQWYRLPAPPTSARLRAIGEPWHPYESIASWYLWKARCLP
jgi:DNA-3-methyladenine glycosylase II